MLEEVRRAQVMEDARRERGVLAARERVLGDANVRRWKRGQQVFWLRDTYRGWTAGLPRNSTRTSGRTCPADGRPKQGGPQSASEYIARW